MSEPDLLAAPQQVRDEVESRFGRVTSCERMPARAHEVWRWDALNGSVVSRTRMTRAAPDSHASEDDERRAQRAAADVGLAPRLLFDIAGGVLMELAPGRPLAAPDLADDGVLVRVTTALRRLHEMDAPAISQPDIRDVLAETLAAGGGPRADSAAAVLDRLVESAPPVACLVHGDPSPANLIDDGQRVRLVDFEYVRLAEPAYDVAALALGAGLGRDPAAPARLASAYAAAWPAHEVGNLIARTSDWVVVLRELFAAWESVQPPSPIG